MMQLTERRRVRRLEITIGRLPTGKIISLTQVMEWGWLETPILLERGRRKRRKNLPTNILGPSNKYYQEGKEN